MPLWVLGMQLLLSSAFHIPSQLSYNTVVKKLVQYSHNKIVIMDDFRDDFQGDVKLNPLR